MALKDMTRSTGYSQEELYFHKLNQELIEKMRAKGQNPRKKGHLTLVHSVDEPEAPAEQVAATSGRKKAA